MSDPLPIVGAVPCSEPECAATAPAIPENRCGGAEDGGGHGCGKVFCGAHLWVTYQYSHLCADDHNGVEDRPGPVDLEEHQAGDNR